MTSSTPIRILVVDDEAAQMRALCDTLSDHGYQMTGFADASAALEVLQTERFALLLTDLNMPNVGGIDLLQAALNLDPDLVGVIMTGEGTIASAVEAMKSGAIDYILKPFKLSVILPVLSRALSIRQLRIDNAELERSVREHTLALETANKELEAFSYSVSHDLRSPLTSIQGAADLLAHHYAEQVPPELRALIDMVSRNADQMKRLIEDLLRLSRLTHQKLEKCDVNVTALVNEILEGLSREETDRKVEIRIDTLPDCVGDPGLLRQVFANLLSNAFKFTRGKPAPLIVVESREKRGETIYSVRDNGAGFDMESAGRLFGAFQRLHSDTEFDGTGVGLSIVRRIVERHGGRIWAEAEPGKGAVFSFSLPDS
jgi:signal transduction histidine kinase